VVIQGFSGRKLGLLKYFMIAVGGAAGAVARYVLGNYIGSRLGFRFPYGTFVINITGCFLVGVSMALFARTTLGPYWRYLVPIGFIGAYTTFSTFEYETLRAIQDGQLATGLMNVALSVVTGFVAVWLGDAVGKAWV
jgi:CrcB protein